MAEIINRLITRMTNESGQALAEYSLVIAFIAIVCVVAVTAIGLAISGGFGSVTGSF
jgi:Flp pilus assembly pilin Flp